MLFTRENGGMKLYADAYSLEFAKDRPFVYLEDEMGTRIADLFVLSSVHSLTGRDDTTAIGQWQVNEGLNEIVFTLETSSSTWESKTIRFRCLPRRFRYEMEVSGTGQIVEADYFGGFYSGQIRWGSGYFWSGQRFKQGFNPEPTVDETYTFAAEAGSSINMTGVPLPGKADWFFTPPPFCLAFEAGSGWTSMGIEARAGENRYTDFQYHGSRSAFHLTLNFEGYTQVEGRYSLPAVAFDFGPDPYTLLAAHVQSLRSAGFIHSEVRKSRPEWWSEPIFCGWGSQCHLANVNGGRAPDYALQKNYEHFLARLQAMDVFPGTVILDDKWQSTYGRNEVDLNKWPDLPGFIRQRHAAGQHVLLWLKAWDPEGVPTEECITNAAGLPLSVDPTNPAFEQRLRTSVRQMLSAEGYDADGFKIDFSARIPSGPGMHRFGSAWGLELMRCYLEIIADETRRVKPDAFIITHTPHPYLADLLDAVRLNDINIQHDVYQQMAHRARVAAIACPEALIDMDNWPIRDKATWRAYLDKNPLLGIPALYYATHIDSTGEELGEEDYATIRLAWSIYREAANAHHRRPSKEKISELGGAFLPETQLLVKKLTLNSTLSVATKPLKAWGKAIVDAQG
jgi:hypothetical protein